MNKGSYIPTPVITDCRQLAPLKSGQWVRLAWCDKPSRLVKWTDAHVTAFHHPKASTQYVDYVTTVKAVAAFAAFNRHARKLSLANA
jgi:hypothetical protein